MRCLEFIKFNDIEPIAFLPLLNKQTTREHLIDHQLFDAGSVKEWVKGKIDIDSSEGCRVRAITVDKQLAGWCGIQYEEGKYEIAVVIEDSFWGIGKSVFFEMMTWAKELGHRTVYIHFFHTRPEYKFLRKIAKHVYQSELLGNKFTTYELEVR